MEIINWKELLYPYEQAVEELLLKFKNLDKECRHLGIYSPVDSVTGRLKTPASILDKAGRKHIAPDHIEEEIEDIAGIRILCQFVEDIQKVVDMVRSRTDMTIVQEKDYITNTKASGYRSYHMIVEVPVFFSSSKKNIRVEVQIRTIAMDFWASLEHKVRYKKNIPADETERLAQELSECAQISADLDQRMQNIRTRLADAELQHPQKQKKDEQILLDVLGL